MRPALEAGISHRADTSFKAFRLLQPAFESHWHYHPELELVFFVQGNGMRFIGDDISLYRAGELFLIGQNLPHTFVSCQPAPADPVEALCIQFSPALFDAFPECRGLNALFQEANRGLAFPTPNDRLTDALRAVVNQTGINALVAFIDLLNGLLTAPGRAPILTRDYQRYATPANTPTRIQQAIDFIHTHYQRPVSMQEMADVCHFSPNAFCRWFRQNIGLTFVDYLNKVRLTHVCQLLISTDSPISQIAVTAGFENISTLNRLFQQKLGTSPRQYRRANRG